MWQEDEELEPTTDGFQDDYFGCTPNRIYTCIYSTTSGRGVIATVAFFNHALVPFPSSDSLQPRKSSVCPERDASPWYIVELGILYFLSKRFLQPVAQDMIASLSGFNHREPSI